MLRCAQHDNHCQCHSEGRCPKNPCPPHCCVPRGHVRLRRIRCAQDDNAEQMVRYSTPAQPRRMLWIHPLPMSWAEAQQREDLASHHRQRTCAYCRGNGGCRVQPGTLEPLCARRPVSQLGRRWRDRRRRGGRAPYPRAFHWRRPRRGRGPPLRPRARLPGDLRRPGSARPAGRPRASLN